MISETEHLYHANGAASRRALPVSNTGIAPTIDSVLEQIGTLVRAAAPGQTDLEGRLTPLLETLRPALMALAGIAPDGARRRDDELAATCERLEGERQRYQELFDAAPDGYLVTDANGVIREGNRAASQLLHLGRERLVGRSLSAFVAREERAAFSALLANLQRGENPPVCELRMRPRGRALFPAALTLAPVRDAAGQLTGLRGLLRDVTQRRRAQDEAARQHRELQQILDAVQAQIWYLDTDGRVLRHNAFASSATGLTAGEVRGGTVLTVAPYWDDPEKRHRETLEVVRTGQARLGSLESFIWQGEERWARVDKVPARDAAGALIGVLVFIYDITDLKRTEEALRRSETRLRALLDSAAEGILALDERGDIQSLNKSGELMFGYAATELIGQNIGRLLPGAGGESADDTGSAAAPLTALQAAGKSREYLARRRNGAVFPVQLTLSDRWDEGRRLTCIVRDITQEKEAQERSLQAERLAAIGQMMTGLAHESRTSLQRCQASLEMLALELRGRQALHHASEIQKSLDDLFQLYEEVRGYAAPIRLKRQGSHLGDIFHEAWDQLADARNGREVFLREQHGDVDLQAEVDRFRLVQVFRNILANALEAAADPVVLDVSWGTTQIADAPALRCVLRDNGPGLKPEQEQKIFEPFYTTKTHGTGLGMAITRRIVEAHGGKITAATAPGGGAEIVITLVRGG